MATQDFLEFRITIEMPLSGSVSVSVTESPAGQASVNIESPFTPEDIERILAMLDGSANASHAEELRAARAFGEKLFNSIFVGAVLDAYYQSLQSAAASNRGLRISLNLEGAGLLATVPWELLRDPRGDHISLTRQVEVVRYVPTTLAREIKDITLPINVLVLISSPSDQASLDPEAEWTAIDEATQELRDRGLLTVERLENAQLLTLQRKLRDSKPFHIFHFVGPSISDETTRTGMLALEDVRRKTTVQISADELARELASENGVRLVVMSTGRTRQEGIRDPFTPVAVRLANRGIPAIIEFQFKLSEEANREFAQEFYTSLAEGHPIEVALTMARRAVQSTMSNLEWATPSIYLNAETSTLFPHRRSYEGNLSTGGLRERLPILMAVAALLIVGLVALLIATRGGDRGIPTVNLAMGRLFIFPRNPTPGEPVEVTVSITNRGTEPVENIQWSFFTQDPADPKSSPAITDTIDLIKPGVTLVAKRYYIFGGWGTFATTAIIDNTNIINTSVTKNVSVFRATTTVEPLVINFQVLPNGTEVFENLNLTGDEFQDWKLKIAPLIDPNDPDCKEAVARIVVDEVEQQWRLVTGQPTPSDQCRSLPIIFSLDEKVSDHVPESATVEFIPTSAGVYTLELRDNAGTVIDSDEVDVNQADADARRVQELTITSTAESGLDETSFQFAVPADASTVIQSVTLTPREN
ncbi:MAG: CHAT domain-containing protein [Anaerolineae bacterium]|nr:CHAT domain-containing protein [Anaerolineae bacterium]